MNIHPYTVAYRLIIQRVRDLPIWDEALTQAESVLENAIRLALVLERESAGSGVAHLKRLGGMSEIVRRAALRVLGQSTTWGPMGTRVPLSNLLEWTGDIARIRERATARAQKEGRG